MNAKGKGTSAERELIHMLWERKWAAHRIAGSGSSHYPSPDIIAGNGGRILAIECKACAGDSQYFSKEEIENLVLFSKMFGAEPYVATKFNRMGWFFMTPMHLKETAASWVMSRKMCELYGKKLDDAIR